jgi:hypothetical protein
MRQLANGAARQRIAAADSIAHETPNAAGRMRTGVEKQTWTLKSRH